MTTQSIGLRALQQRVAMRHRRQASGTLLQAYHMRTLTQRFTSAGINDNGHSAEPDPLTEVSPSIPEDTTSPNAIDEFFAGYPAFDYDKTKPIIQQFQAMCFQFKWWRVKGLDGKWRDDARKVEAKTKFDHALVSQFNTTFGTDEHDLAAWQHLCEILNISPIPAKIHQCRQAVRNAHVNLVDLVEYHRIGQDVEKFTTVEDLSEYTHETDKFFPRNHAKAGGLLRFLLRRIA